MDVGTLLAAGAERLAAAGHPSGPADARLLLAHAWDRDGRGLDRARLLGEPVPDPVVTAFTGYLGRREHGEPVQYIVGTAPFRYSELTVGPGVFIPRPETELLVQAVLDWCVGEHLASPAIADLCAGSGAIALALAGELEAAAVTAVELSPAALEYTRRNLAAAFEGMGDSSVEIVAGDALTYAGGPFDAVVSNPPYVPAGSVTAEVAASDPALALFGGGEDGLDFPLRLIPRARTLLRPGGFFAMEHAEEQARAVADAYVSAGFVQVTTHADYTGRSRFTTGCAPV